VRCFFSLTILFFALPIHNALNTQHWDSMPFRWPIFANPTAVPGRNATKMVPCQCARSNAPVRTMSAPKSRSRPRKFSNSKRSGVVSVSPRWLHRPCDKSFGIILIVKLCPVPNSRAVNTSPSRLRRLPIQAAQILIRRLRRRRHDHPSRRRPPRALAIIGNVDCSKLI
jgi:hypothetical protein